MPEEFFGTMKCCDCGTLILASLGNQTHRRCLQCWKDRHPLATLEIVNASVRRSAKAMVRHHRRSGSTRDKPVVARKARTNARKRLSTLFPDLYAMLLDEERVKLGMAPIARYELNDFEEAASKTLGFESVYDALDSSGVTDG